MLLINIWSTLNLFNMEMCRVCLTTDAVLHRFNETFVFQYNLLTNLDITFLDGTPQVSCDSCLRKVKYFIEFREKAIASETTYRELFLSDLRKRKRKSEKEQNQAKTKVHDKKINNMLKYEIKDEIVENDCVLEHHYRNIDIENKGLKSNKKQNKTKSKIQDENLNNAIKYEIKDELEDNDCILDNFDVIYEEYDGDIRNLLRDEDVKPKKKRKKKKGVETTVPKSIENIFDGDKWFCGICPKEFEEQNEVNMHLDVHKGERQCDLCKEKVNSISQLFAHRLLHVPAKQFNCHICAKRFKSCIYLEHHYRNIHIEEDDKKLDCPICQSSYSTPKKLNSHIMHVHSSKRFFCDMCSKGFSNKTNLKSHIKHHSDMKSYVCDLCGFSCNYSGGLKDHKIRRHSQKKIYCKNCARVFSSQLDHDKHKCKAKLRVCPICGLQLTGSSRLSSHMRRHSDVYRYECDRCPAKYKSRGALVAHTNRHDGNRTKQCEYCPAKFYTTTVLIKHRRTHTGEKPYVCKVCSKGFTGGNNLKVHMKVHGEYLVVKKTIKQDINNVTK